MNNQQHTEYIRRINLVINHIEENLDQKLSLADLARIASFSPFHFHRIFGAIMGERLNHYIQRLRIEKASAKLIYNPSLSITEIALECGFNSSASFARAFKDHFKVSARQWRSGAYKD